MSNLELLLSVYNEAYIAGKVNSKAEFADLLGVKPATISRAFGKNPAYLNEKLAGRLRALHEELAKGKDAGNFYSHNRDVFSDIHGNVSVKNSTPENDTENYNVADLRKQIAELRAEKQALVATIDTLRRALDKFLG